MLKLNCQRYLLYFIPALLVSRLSLAQFPDYHVRLIDESEHIHNIELRKEIKDNRDFLWILYPDRIQRMDGRQVIDFSPSDRMISILNDHDGGIWASSVYYVFRYENDHKGFVRIPFDTSGGISLSFLFQLPGKAIWLQTSRGYYEYNKQENRFVRLNLPELEIKSPINFRRFTQSGNTIFFCDDDSLYAYNAVKRQRKSLPLKNSFGIYAFSEDRVLVSTWKNLSFWYDFKKNEISAFDLTSLGDKNRGFFTVNDLERMDEKRYLVSTASGLYEMDAQTFSLKELNLYLKGQPWKGGSYRDIYIDRKKNVHVSFDFGIVIFPVYPFQIGLVRNRETDPEKSWSSQARGFAPDEKNNLWVSTSRGFAYWDLKKNHIRAFHAVEGATDRLNFPSVRGIYDDGKNLILGPTNNGVWLYEPAIGKYKRPLFEKNEQGEKTRKKIENDFIRHINRLRSGNYIIVARDAVYTMDENTYTIREVDYPGKKENNIFSYEDSHHQIWIGTTRGLYCLDSAFNTRVSVTSSTQLYSMYEISDDEYLVGGFNGLFRARMILGRLSLVPDNPYFSEMSIAIILKDKNGKFWLGTGEGLYRYDLDTKKVELFGSADNVQTNSYSNNSFYIAPDGMFFLGGSNGINYFYPEKIRPHSDSLKLSIVKFSINDDDSSFSPGPVPLHLKHSQNSVEIAYVAPVFGDGSRLHYRYMLQGIDTGWHYHGNNNSIRFSSLSPGNYVFRVAASENGEEWFEASQSISFTIEPPFWKTWWFIVLFILTSASVSTLLVKRRIRFIKKRETEKTELQKLRAEGYQSQLEIEQVINYFTTSLNNHTTIDGMLWDIARNCIARLGFEDCVIYLLDETSNTLVQKAAWGPKTSLENNILDPIEIPLGRGIVGSVAMSGKAEKINDTSKDERYIVDDERRFSEITVPIFQEGKVIGVIDSEDRSKNFYTDRHMQILATIALNCGARIATLKAEAKTASARMEALLNKQKALEASLQSMRLQMNPHFLFNALNSIQQMILAGEETTATRFLSKFSRLLRLVLTTSDKEEVTLKEELEILNLYVELESLRFKESFSYSIICNPSVDTEETYVPALFFQPFVENAIWHGLMHKEGKRRLHIHFDERSDGALLCSIEDNGVGRQASSINGKTTRDMHTGKGLSVARERIKALNEKNGTRSSVEIIDLEEDGKAAGTKISIVISPSFES